MSFQEYLCRFSCAVCCALFHEVITPFGTRNVCVMLECTFCKAKLLSKDFLPILTGSPILVNYTYTLVPPPSLSSDDDDMVIVPPPPAVEEKKHPDIEYVSRFPEYDPEVWGHLTDAEREAQWAYFGLPGEQARLEAILHQEFLRELRDDPSHMSDDGCEDLSD